MSAVELIKSGLAEKQYILKESRISIGMCALRHMLWHSVDWILEPLLTLLGGAGYTTYCTLDKLRAMHTTTVVSPCKLQHR